MTTPALDLTTIITLVPAIQVKDDVLIFPGLTPSERQLLLVLLCHYNPNDAHRIYPPIFSLAKKMNATDRWVRKLLGRLQAKGFLVVVRSTTTSHKGKFIQKTNRFYLTKKVLSDETARKFFGNDRSAPPCPIVQAPPVRSDSQTLKDNSKKKTLNTPPPTSSSEGAEPKALREKEEFKKRFHLSLVSALPSDWQEALSEIALLLRLKPSTKEKTSFVRAAIDRGLSLKEAVSRAKIYAASPYHRQNCRYLTWLFHFDVAMTKEAKEKTRLITRVRAWEDPFAKDRTYGATREEYFAWLGIDDRFCSSAENQKEEIQGAGLLEGESPQTLPAEERSALNVSLEPLKNTALEGNRFLEGKDPSQIDAHLRLCNGITQAEQSDSRPLNEAKNFEAGQDALIANPLQTKPIERVSLQCPKKFTQNAQLFTLRNRIFRTLCQMIPDGPTGAMLTALARITDVNELQNLDLENFIKGESI